MRTGSALALGALGALGAGGCATQSPFPMPTPQIGWPNSTPPRTRDDVRLERALAETDAATRPSYVLDSLIGARSFEDEAAWAPLEDQLDLGVSFLTPLLGERSMYLDRTSDWFSWDLGLAYAFDRSTRTGLELDSRIFDLSVGVLFEPPSPRARLRPFVGAGWDLAFTRFERQTEFGRDRESDVVGSPYLRAGLRFLFQPNRHFGVDFRWRGTHGDNPVDGVNGDVESMTVSLLLGAAF